MNHKDITTLHQTTPRVEADGVLVLEKDNLRFFAAHFVAKLDPENPGKVLRETLHGHNYKVTCEVYGPKTSPTSPYIIDKNDIQEAAKRICDTFHSKMLIPTRSPALEVRDCFPDPEHVVMRVVGTKETF
jgi:6-pyruvoyl-tetrahydropterin synthase